MCFSLKCSNSDFHLKYFTEPDFNDVEEELPAHQNPRCIQAMTMVFADLNTLERPEDKKYIELLDRFRKAISITKIPKRTAKYYRFYINDPTMIIACWFGYTDLVKDLYARGIPLNIQTVSKYTPLHYAAQTGNFDLAKFIIGELKFLEDKDSKFGRTPLHIACSFRHIIIANELIKNKADLHAIDAAGNTPLHLAFCDFNQQNNDRKLAGRIGLFLFSKGANPLLKNSSGKIPVNWISKDDLETAFSTFPVSTAPLPFPRDVWEIILRKLPNDFLFENVRPTCKFLNNASLKSVINDLFSKSKPELK